MSGTSFLFLAKTLCPSFLPNPGATCHPVSGNCSCTPGYMGPLCELPCQNKTFGEGCQEKCSCPDGYNCDHVTGGCLRYQLNISQQNSRHHFRCQENTWGPACRENCTCSREGTALCSREDGRCFCEANFRGSNCEEHCPFGFYGDG